MDALLIANDQTIRVLGVQDEISGNYINNLVTGVTAHIKNMNGTSVAGETWPITLIYVSGSDGDYRGNFDNAIKLVNNRDYIIEIGVDAGGGLKAFWRFVRPAQYRQPQP